MNVDRFVAASNAAQKAIVAVSDARSAAERGHVIAAWYMVITASEEFESHHRRAIEEFEDELAAVSDSVIRVHGLTVMSFATAHEAVLHITATIGLAFHSGHFKRALEEIRQSDWPCTEAEFNERMADKLNPIWNDFAACLEFDTSELVARLKRERVKLVRLPGFEPPRKSKNESTLDAQALAVFLDHTDWKKAEIARHLGKKDAQSLSPQRCPRLHAAMSAMKAAIDPTRRARRGTKDKEGNLEAWEEE